MDTTIRAIVYQSCTGCGACYNKCPVNAIEMVRDAEGFSFPQIKTELCVNCGQCLRACPVAEPNYNNIAAPHCYAVMANDEIRSMSSSGGVFTLLAEWMLGQGGVVCGAAYTEDCYSVEHIIVRSRDELHKLRGSKYVQSNTKTVYREVKTCLDAGAPVLFTGTPCQVAALNSFLGKEYTNLYTLDLVCHGVPSPMVYEKFVREQEAIYGSKAVRVSFRDKDVVQWNVSTTIDFSNGQRYFKRRNDCDYMKSFLKMLTIRKSCGQCRFATMPRQGDMTIADFWDISRHDPNLDDQKGTSLVLTNNEKGKRLLDVLRNEAITVTEAPLEHGIKYNAQLKYSSVLHPRRDRFFDLVSNYNYSMSKAVDYGMNRKFDVGYVGWWYGANYGSAMTNYALNRVLTDMGKSVLMLEFPIMTNNVPKTKADTKTRRFANHFYEQSMFYNINDYGMFNNHCDSFVLGSDQLWNWWSNRDVGTYHFFLDFVDDKHKKIAYSTSFGHDNAYYPEDMKLKVSYLLNRFDAISVREKGGVAVCRDEFNADAVQTVDPVFLCSMNAYEEAIALSELNIDHEYVLAYILNPTEEKINAVRYTAEQMGLPYHIILDGQANFEELKAQANDPNVLENVEISDWLKYFKDASYVVTDSFHGFCYSIIFRCGVTVFPNKLRGLSRFESLSELTGLEDRLYFSFDDMIQRKPWNTPVDYETVWARMEPQIEYSRRWLEEALEMEKRPSSSKELSLKLLTQLETEFAAIEKYEKLLAEQVNLTEKISNAKHDFYELIRLNGREKEAIPVVTMERVESDGVEVATAETAKSVDDAAASKKEETVEKKDEQLTLRKCTGKVLRFLHILKNKWFFKYLLIIVWLMKDV